MGQFLVYEFHVLGLPLQIWMVMTAAGTLLALHLSARSK
jgi:hypothetical protein